MRQESKSEVLPLVAACRKFPAFDVAQLFMTQQEEAEIASRRQLKERSVDQPDSDDGTDGSEISKHDDGQIPGDLPVEFGKAVDENAPGSDINSSQPEIHEGGTTNSKKRKKGQNDDSVLPARLAKQRKTAHIDATIEKKD